MLSGLPLAEINIDFLDDILGNISGALLVLGEARKDNWGKFADIAYVNNEIEDETLTPYFNSLSSKTESWIISTAGLACRHTSGTRNIQ
jgi:hypothetical protein